MPGIAERSIGSLVAPDRSGSIRALINAVTREVGVDAAEWPVDRILGMASQLEREADKRRDAGE